MFIMLLITRRAQRFVLQQIVEKGLFLWQRRRVIYETARRPHAVMCP
uniref:Uncharacterized protein n=1 Tax=Anguilla anguilla TaxID=7936 RepID=A0A0E9SH24_ANGAN